MGRHSKSVVFILMLLIFFGIPSLHAKWEECGIAVSQATGDQFEPQITSDGAGGAIITWRDDRSGNIDIYAQAIDERGIVQWTADGAAICAATGDQYSPQLTSDGAGGAIITWEDRRSGNTDIYAQRIDAGGSVQWTADGAAICTTTDSQWDAQITPGGAGGAIITWSDNRSGNVDIYAQAIDENGIVQWTADGAAICTATGNQYSSQLTSDGAGGAIITWEDNRSGNWDIYAQRIDASGSVQWTADGAAICTATDGQSRPQLTSDGAGGAIITWEDYRSGNNDIYAQAIDESGIVQWTDDGVAICMATNNQYKPQLTSDGAGGAIITWQDGRSGDYDIYAQAIDAIGTVQWTADGIVICTATDDQVNLQLTSDGAGGAIITWEDRRRGTISEIYAQRVAANGNVQWTEDGVAICEEWGDLTPRIISDGAGGAIITWEDAPDRIIYNIYAQRIERNGYWGYPSPSVTEVEDVPYDQGGVVTVTWDATRLDRFPYEVVTHYSVWRRLSGHSALAVPDRGRENVDLSKIDILFDSSAVRYIPAGDAAYGWGWVGDMIAANFDEYTYAAPTLYDSIGTDTGYHHFLVIAHAEDPFVYWVSDSDSGYSVDNLSPAQPQGFAGIQSLAPQGLRLSWLANTEEDLSHYTIHRGDDEFFVPDGSNQVGTTGDTVFIDTEWIVEDNYFYKMTACDVHGNEGMEALLRPEDITVGTLLQSFAASLVTDCVEITWVLSEAGAGMEFFVLRAEEAGGFFEELVSPEIEAEGLRFRCIDGSVEPGEAYRYRIEVEDEDGRRILFETGPIATPAIPLTLYQNHPNPFNPSTTIRYYLPANDHVTLDIYDVSGKWISRLVKRDQERGTHAVEWNGHDKRGNHVTSGVYFYRLMVGKKRITKKMILLK